jgi:hypothetical protein
MRCKTCARAYSDGPAFDPPQNSPRIAPKTRIARIARRTLLVGCAWPSALARAIVGRRLGPCRSSSFESRCRQRIFRPSRGVRPTGDDSKGGPLTADDAVTALRGDAVADLDHHVLREGGRTIPERGEMMTCVPCRRDSVTLRRVGRSAPALAALSVRVRSTHRITTRISISATAAPRQRRTPPPKGIQPYVDGGLSRKRSGRNASGSGYRSGRVCVSQIAGVTSVPGASTNSSARSSEAILRRASGTTGRMRSDSEITARRYSSPSSRSTSAFRRASAAGFT